MERDEDNEGFTRVQGRRRRERQTQEGNTEREEIDSNPTTENHTEVRGRYDTRAGHYHTQTNQRDRHPRNLQAASRAPSPVSKIGRGGKTSRLKSAAKLYWLFLGRLDERTTAEEITEHLKEKGITDVKECVKTPEEETSVSNWQSTRTSKTKLRKRSYSRKE